MTEPHLHIVIPTHNRAPKALRLLSCLEKQSFPKFTVYLVDDGSTDGTSEQCLDLFEGRVDLEILHGDGNLWWGGSMRLGLQAALREAGPSDIVAMMNDDIHFDSDFLRQAMAVIKSYPHSMIGFMSVDEEDGQTLLPAGSVMRCWPLALTVRPFEGLKLSASTDEPLVREADFLGARATFLPAEAIRRTGPVNAKALPHYHCDGEFSYRVKSEGFGVLVCRFPTVFLSAVSTGQFNTTPVQEASWRALVRSFWSPSSPNHWRARFNFAKLTCPKHYLLPYLICDTAKALTRSVALLLFGKRYQALRRSANDVFARRGSA